jgi:uncharacterized membrane protein YfcA
MFDLLVLVAAVIAGGIASIAGFGIGSILTPLLAVALGTKLSVAVVSIPHLVATALRFALIRAHLDRRVFLTFGITSGLGGLAGALLHVWLRSVILSYILGYLLVFAGITGLTGLASRMRFARTTGWIAGGLSGIFGGLVGNQGGIRSAALLGFDVSKESFVATATAIALLVDGFRCGDPMARCRLSLEAGAYWHRRRGGGHSCRPAGAAAYPAGDVPRRGERHHPRTRHLDVGPSRGLAHPMHYVES